MLLTAIEMQSISRAAQKSYITQQGLSTAIRRVEAAIGRDLLERRPDGVTLSPHGKAIFETLRGIVNSADIAMLIASSDAIQDDELVIGVTSPAAVGVLGVLLGRLPNVRLKIRQLNFDQLISTLTYGLADIVITFGPLAMSGWVSTPLYREGLGVLLPKSHRFAQERSLHASQLLNEVFLTGRSLPSTWTEVGRLDTARGGRLARLGDPQLTDVRNPAEVNEMVAARIALVTAPMSHARSFPHPFVSLVPLDDHPSIEVVALHRMHDLSSENFTVATRVLSILQEASRSVPTSAGASHGAGVNL